MEEENSQPQEEENSQPQEAENNNLNRKPEDKQEWKKWLVITIAAFLGGFFCVFVMTHHINRVKAQRVARDKNAFSQQLMDAASGLNSPETSTESYHSETVEITDDNQHSMRIEDYEMKYKYKGKFFNREFSEKFESKKNVPEVELKVIRYKAEPVTINYKLDGETYKVFINAPNYTEDQIKYELNGNKIKVFGASKIENEMGTKDISFSQEAFLPAPAKKDKIEVSNQDGKYVISVPLELED